MFHAGSISACIEQDETGYTPNTSEVEGVKTCLLVFRAIQFGESSTVDDWLNPVHPRQAGNPRTSEEPGALRNRSKWFESSLPGTAGTPELPGWLRVCPSTSSTTWSWKVEGYQDPKGLVHGVPAEALLTLKAAAVLFHCRSVFC